MPDSEASGASNFIDLPSGEALTEVQAGEVTRTIDTRLVVVAGTSQSGKTTILTSLFEAFLEAPFAGFLFAGSKTMVGFEKRCHDGRESSGRSRPGTTHTPIREGVALLHLQLANADAGLWTHTNLLLSDISGEMFKKLRDSTKAVLDLKLLHRADHFCVVIDGERIVDPRQRHIAQNDARSIYRSILEAGVLGSHGMIQVAFTKWDVVVAALAGEQKDAIKHFLEETKQAFLKMSGTDRSIRFHEVAARPENLAVPFAHGVPTLLREWIQDGHTSVQNVIYLNSPKERTREFGRVASVSIARGIGKEYDVRWI